MVSFNCLPSVGISAFQPSHAQVLANRRRSRRAEVLTSEGRKA
jgi:hypothetical protein